MIISQVFLRISISTKFSAVSPMVPSLIIYDLDLESITHYKIYIAYTQIQFQKMNPGDLLCYCCLPISRISLYHVFIAMRRKFVLSGELRHVD